MKTLFAVIAALMCGTAMADLVATNGENEIRLMTAEPCTNPAILEQLKQEYHSQFKRATATIKGKALPGCWIDTMEGAYYLQFPDGGLAFPVEMFTEQGV